MEGGYYFYFCEDNIYYYLIKESSHMVVVFINICIIIWDMNRYNTTEKIDKKHSKIEQIGEDSVINITFQIIIQSDNG